jgi:hypothetical protein
MMAIEVTLNIVILGGLMLCAFVVGYLLRSRQLKKAYKKVIELEKEMLSNHADILQLQKEKVTLMKQMNESKIPVIPMKSSKEDSDKSRHAN